MLHGNTKYKRYGAFSIITLALLLLSTSVFFLLKPHTPSHAAAVSSYNWKPLKIGAGGYVTGIAIHPTTPNLMYVRTDVGGAYKLGANDTWQQLIVASAVPNLTPSDYNVESLAVSKSNDQTLYLAVGDDLTNQTGRILKSSNQGQSFTDNGQRWYIGGNQDYRQGAERLAVDPNNDNVAYFGSRKDGLWVTIDGGQTWTQVSTSSIPVGSNTGTAVGDSFVVFDPGSGTTNGKTNRIYVGVAGSGVYMSPDAGASWTNVMSIASTLVPFSASIASDGTLYVGFDATSGAGAVEKYAPASNTVTTISPSSSVTDYKVAADPTNPQRVIVVSGGVTGGNMWRTTNGGTNWDTLSVTVSSSTIPWVTNTDESNYLSSSQIVFDPLVAGKLWFPEGIGLWYSTDTTGSTVNWTFYSQGIEETVTSDLIAPPGDAPTSNIFDRQGFYHANPDSYPTQPLIDGAFWGGTSLDYSGGTPGTLVTVQAKNNYSPSLTGRGATSTDGGKTWQLFGSTPTNNVGGNIAISATDPNNLVWLPSTGNFGQGNPPYYSQDGGKTWSQSAGITSPNTHWLFWWGSKRALASDKVNNAFYAITFSSTTSATGTFYTSTDGGKTFAQAANSPACEQNGDCHVYGQIHAAPGYAGHVWSSAAKDGLWYTTDAGQSAWVKVSGVQQARAFGFGKALPGYSYPAIYLYGEANGDTSFGVYRSPDQGATWTLVSQAPLGINQNLNVVTGDMNTAGRVYVGFTGNGFAYGDDQNLSQEPTPTPTQSGNNPLPSAWQQQDIGNTGSTGSGSYSNGAFTESGSGTDIWGNADGLHYIYQPLSGDGTIIAHVNTVQNTDGWAKAGVMIRESLDANATFADTIITPANGTAFQRRTATGGSSVHTGGPNVAAPYWVKLVRSGNTFISSVSSDGSSWTQVGTDTITMASSVYIGLAVTAHNYGTLNTSTFDQVSVTASSGALVAHATSAPTIDGNSTDAIWSTAASYPITKTQGSPSGFSASYQSAWDSNNLYLLLKVQDGSYAANPDMVELYLDPGHNGGSSYDSADMQYQFPSNSTTVTQYNGGTKGTNTSGITFANQGISGGYQVEIAIPWARLGGTPASNTELGVDVSVWQNFGSGVKNKLYWNNASDNDWTNPSLFGDAVLQN
jgi:hypothetical protein